MAILEKSMIFAIRSCLLGQRCTIAQPLGNAKPLTLRTVEASTPWQCLGKDDDEKMRWWLLMHNKLDLRRFCTEVTSFGKKLLGSRDGAWRQLPPSFSLFGSPARDPLQLKKRPPLASCRYLDIFVLTRNSRPLCHPSPHQILLRSTRPQAGETSTARPAVLQTSSKTPLAIRGFSIEILVAITSRVQYRA